MKLISREARITSFSRMQGGIAFGRGETIVEYAIPALSHQNLQGSEARTTCVVENHLARIGRISHCARSLPIFIFSVALACGIPTHAQGRIDPTLPPAPFTHTRTLFIFPGADTAKIPTQFCLRSLLSRNIGYSGIEPLIAHCLLKP